MRTIKIAVIHGPNLNFLGIREPQVYGNMDYNSLVDCIAKETAKSAKDEKIEVKLAQFQSNHEGEIIDLLQKCHNEDFDGIVINPGAFSHYSYAIADAIASIKPTVIEVHLTNVYAREEFRHKSVTAPACKGQIAGFGFDSYVLATSQLIKLYKE